jgi:hypothetical protein
LQIEQNLNIRSCTSSWCCIDDFISQELNVGLYLAFGLYQIEPVGVGCVHAIILYLCPSRLSMYQVGFRFAPKLHGILTKAQAVLQLFSLLAYVASGEIVNFMCHYLILLAKRLMHYQVG